ncbi:hypothetical protein [Vibrio penaeicida]|uniref:DUF3718 domain-containing protein n=1 Tax=Vibrio penaeicida TaxID=104609 RepID=A0AAV5NZB8_9VIBR|nr:hypothetical protein [Vibrio penaeicida]RTZ19344.1 hypothetical protein EKN09_27505 [Vibrio penaeicida]GLQ75910.1 hypothetical protein GCM10007932_52730 [Vibrio penaeicida]
MSQYLKLGMIAIGLLMNVVTASAHNSINNDQESYGKENSHQESYDKDSGNKDSSKQLKKYYVKFSTHCKGDVFSKLKAKEIDVLSELIHDNVFIVKMRSEQVNNVAGEPCVNYIEPVPKREMHEDANPFQP